LVGELLGRADGSGHGRGGEHAVRPPPRTQDHDIFAAYWPHASDEDGATPFNDATKYVASRSHPALEWWSPSVLIEGDAADGIAALKREDGPELQVHGSGDLIQTLLRHNLVDQYRLWVFPLVIGSGKRLFAEGTSPSGLKSLTARSPPPAS
jgi:dihydrofolate reductase